MELDLSADQELLRQTAARFIETACPLPRIRALVDTDTALPDGYLPAAGDLGWYALLVPEEYGGGSISGDGLRDLAIVAEERGRALQPGPFTSTNVVAATVATAGSAEQRAAVLPSLGAGEESATWVTGDAAGADDIITAHETPTGFEIDGRSAVVQDGVLARWLLVTTSAHTAPLQFLVEADAPGVTVTALRGHDITQRVAAVEFDHVVVPTSAQVGTTPGTPGDIERQLQIACVLTAAESVGALDALFALTCRYAVDRTAFGRPIGSFQAVKHQLADMSLLLECGKAITAAATRAVAAGDADAGEIASMAKAWIGDSGIDITQGCFQVFGGIGHTWEHDLHLYLRRATMNGLLFGSSAWHRDRICRMHGVNGNDRDH